MSEQDNRYGITFTYGVNHASAVLIVCLTQARAEQSVLHGLARGEKIAQTRNF
jgi:hypothetical protein